MNNLIKLSKLLPKYDDIKNVCSQEAEATYILKLATESMKSIQENPKEALETDAEEVSYLLQCLVDKCWERIHTGHFSEVPLPVRKIYAIANYYKVSKKKVAFLMNKVKNKLNFRRFSTI